jgi:cell division protein FtsB
MLPEIPSPTRHALPGKAAEPLRRKRAAAPAPPETRRKLFQLALVFVTIVLLVDAMVGEKGFVETLRARRQTRELAASLDAARRANAQLREEARRLREDPSTIESLAREDLGLIRPGEMLFIIKDAKPPKTP